MDVVRDGDVISPGEKTAEAVLFDRYRRDRDAVTRDLLVGCYLPLARHLARRYVGRADVDDLTQVASLGLLKAIDRFDPGRGLAFSSFAVPTILGEAQALFSAIAAGWCACPARCRLKLRLDTVHVDRRVGPLADGRRAG